MTRGGINVEAVFALCVILAAVVRCRLKEHRQPAVRRSFSQALPLDIAACIAGIVVVAAAYWRVRNLPFLSDDFILVRIGKDLSSQGAQRLFTTAGGDGFFRPLGLLSLGFTWPWADADPTRWRLIALALHTLNTVLVYALGRSLGLTSIWSWFGSALFAVHAAHPEAVVWIAGRFDLLATALVLIGLVAFICYWDGGGMTWGAVALLAMVGGMLSKESGYALPVMMAVYAFARPGFKLRSCLRLVLFFTAAVICFAYRWHLLRGVGGYVVQAGPNRGEVQAAAFHPLSLANALLVRLWAVLFFPVNWSVAGTWLFAAVLVCALGWVLLAWRPIGSRSGVAIALGFALASALPAASLLLIGADLEKARLLYLPSVGFCLLAAFLLQMAPPKLGPVAAVILLGFQLAALEHNLGIWQEVAKKSQAVCEAAVECSRPESVKGLPRVLDGVYFFGNGFPECVRLLQSQRPGEQTHECHLTWDPATSGLSQTE